VFGKTRVKGKLSDRYLITLQVLKVAALTEYPEAS